jgi:hypothetical protein
VASCCGLGVDILPVLCDKLAGYPLILRCWLHLPCVAMMAALCHDCSVFLYHAARCKHHVAVGTHATYCKQRSNVSATMPCTASVAVLYCALYC